VPNCYYVVSSEPEGTGKDASDCAQEFGGVASVIARERHKRRFVLLVWYPTVEEAEANLDEIKGCLERKHHRVHEHDVLEDITTDLGITVEGYVPYPPPGSTGD